MPSAAGAIAARTQGDDFQARWFLLEAMRLFDPNSHVVRVALEQKQLFPWFDDVVTFYGDKKLMRRRIDAHQVKFHVVGNGALSIDSMIDPSFIGSKSTSLLQRILAVHSRRGGDCDVVLASPWGLDPSDLLAHMVQVGLDGTLRLNVLFDGKAKSDAAAVRRMLCQHAAADEQQLHDALERLRVIQTLGLPFIMAFLNESLARHGYATISDATLVNAYDDLVRKIVQSNGAKDFDRTAIAALLREADLVAESEPARRHRVGVRSFIRHVERLDDYVDEILDVLALFNGRYLQPDASWDIVRDRVVNFMGCVDDARHEEIELYIPCHNSIAFAAGHAVSPKSATRYFVHQPSAGGAAIWALTRPCVSSAQLWRILEIPLRDGAPDVAVAVGLTHNIVSDVKGYVERNVPSVGVLLAAEPIGGGGSQTVRDGAHALALAEGLDVCLAERRTVEQRKSMLHAFMAVPNGFAFAFGRSARRVGQVTTYEYDFERKDPDGYSPAVVFTP